MEYKIQYRRFWEDGTYSEWKSYKSRVYKVIENANQAIVMIGANNRGWGFDLELYKMWKYEYRIIERNKIIKSI